MPTRTYTGEDVVTAARRRIGFVFDQFEDIIVSISGGKDSTVLAHLALEEAHRRGRRIGIFFLDEEVVYQSTIDQVEKILSFRPDAVKRMWLQIPFKLTNATSLEEGQLQAWEPNQRKVWMRPKGPQNIKHKPWTEEEERSVSSHKEGIGFYGALDNFERQQRNTAFLVGLRAIGESMNRWRAVTKNPVEIGGTKVFWGSKKRDNFTLYPIYDWDFHDVWKYLHEYDVPYSKIYDMQFRKGYPMARMRVSSLIHEQSFKSICDLPEFEPRTYKKLLKRIKGIALAQETGRDAKLFACRKLPKNYNSWKQYRDFLIQTHPDQKRLGVFQKRFSKHLDNEYVARQQCRQLILNDYENNLPIDNDEDPREKLLQYYEEVL